MFRAAVLTTVLLLATGQNAALLCGVSCNSHEPATPECHHQDVTTPAVSGDDNCDSVVLIASAFVREDVRRETSAADARHALAGPRLQVAPSSVRSAHSAEPGFHAALPGHPRTLRI